MNTPGYTGGTGKIGGEGALAGSGIFRNRWWIVFASVLGLMASQGSILIFGSAVFMKPVTEELGIGRGAFSFGLTVATLLSAFASPALGWLIDKRGVRSVLLFGIVAFALATAAMSLLSSSLVVFYLLFALSGLTSTSQLPTGYAKVVSEWFDKERGLALGIAVAGFGLGVALIPQIANRLIQNYGWRAAYVGLGITIFVLAFGPVFAFVRDAFPRGRSQSAADQKEIPGLAAKEVIEGSWRFWAMLVSFLFATVAINGTLTHIVALLTDRGVPTGLATAALSASGLAVIVGRILAGYLLDRIFGRNVAIFFFMCPMIGIVLLAIGPVGPIAVVGGLLCGAAIGAELDFMAFFVSRYFGLKAFGQLYGYMMCVLSIGSGLGATLMGLSYDRAHSYWPMLMIFEVLLVISCVLIAPLGPYRFPARSHTTTVAV